MSCCEITTLDSIRATETWDGWSGSLSSDGTSFADDLESLTLSFTLASESTAALTINGVVDDAAAWEWSFADRTPLGLDAGFYSWEITTVDSAGRTKTYYTGTLEVTD